MCGIVGVAGKIFMKEERTLRTLLVLDSLRGEDSTGVAVIPKVGNSIVAKELGNPYNLFDTKRFETALKKVNRAIIGHNRYATQGAVSKKNAHPFDFDTLVGVHNGTLKNKYRLDDATDFDVDSENLYHHMEKHGLADVLNVMDGAWALVWWDKKEETLNMLRNKERPLFVVATKDGESMFWASEKWMLSVACSRNGVEINDIHEVAEDMLYTFHIKADGKLDKPHIKASPSTYVAPVYTNNNWKNQGQASNFSQATKDVSLGNVVALPKPDEKKNQMVEPTKVDTELQNSYSNAKRVLFEVVGSRIDCHGARYVQLMDIITPAAPVRLYLKRNDPMQHMVGREVIADISGFCAKRGEGAFFKASTWNVIIVPETKGSPDGDYLIYKDNTGRLFTKKEWEKKYPNCDYCFDPLFAEDHGNRLTNDGNCLCSRCAGNPAAVEGVKLSKVY